MVSALSSALQLKVRLSLCHHISYGEKLQTLLHYEDWGTLLAANTEQLAQQQLAPDTVRALQAVDTKALAITEAWLLQPQHTLIDITDSRYPPMLRHAYHPPPLLYIYGNPSLLSQPALAIVGSRHPTPRGKALAYRFSQQLSDHGLVIVSGMALGIDGQAHLACTQSQQPTIAVLGCGADVIYPKTHRRLYQAIAEQGAIITEYTLNTSARSEHFPARNRIISGLSLGVLVIEAAKRSGSLITARLAAEAGREVFALPGALSNPLSKGCHYLINQGAKLVECVEDIVVELPSVQGKKQKSNKTNTKKLRQNKDSSLDGDHRILLECLRTEAINLQQLMYYSQLPLQRVTQCLVELELQGEIEHNHGKYYRVRAS